MKTLMISLTLFVVLISKVSALGLNDLRAGDVVLLSLNCYECRMIESETESKFSHSGVVILDEVGSIRIAQSLGKLDHFSIAEFTKNITPKTFVHVYRPKEFSNLSKIERFKLNKNVLDIFNEKFKGAPFDSKFLWNNFTDQGEELLYCSEFIAKFLDHFMSLKTIPFPISYKKHYDYWFKLFNGVVPEGEIGNSPAAFSRDYRFEFLGTI